ncbi:beta-D-glucosyl crocetin beta-1,6-glucosyltransferase-like [Capsicum galapagoense]
MAGSSIFNAFFIVFFVAFFSAMAETSAQELAPAPAPDAGAAFAMPSSGLLVGTSLLLYSKASLHRLLAGIVKVKVLPIGTLVQDPMASVDGNIEIMERLGKKEKFSTTTVSFWEVGDRGMVMGGWAPQAKILTHSSIGGFVSHYGWNSISESIDYGIPTIAMPMNLDQPMNAKLLVEIGVALEVLRDENGAFHREDIARVIKDVICGKLGENLRNKNVEDINVLLLWS